MYADVNVVRVGHIDRDKLRFERVTLDNGETLSGCIFNEYALPIMGYIPLKLKDDATETLYINVDKVISIAVSDEQQENMRTDLVKPKEYKVKG